MGKVLVLGADGFIGRHIAFALRDAGWSVLASARRTTALDAMGFKTLHADLLDPRTHDVEFWKHDLIDVDACVNAAGLLTGSDNAMSAVHEKAPTAVYGALTKQCPTVLVSAIGIDDADTPFARHRRTGENVATAAGAMILRPGLVLADTSYGGSSLARALAVLPFVRPVVGDGQQAFNPIHASDLAAVINHLLLHPMDSTPRPIGGPETVTQSQMGARMRDWFGLPPVRTLHLPLWLARVMGMFGDVLRLGPISRTAVDQLNCGVLAPTNPDLATLIKTPRPFSKFATHRPAGTQDLWHARLYLLRPIVRLTLAVMWFASGLLGVFLPAEAFLPLAPDWPPNVMEPMARLGGVVDLGIALALVRNWKPDWMVWAQLGMVAGYTAAFTIIAPELWFLPLGGLLKNLPILVLITIYAVLERER